MRGDLVVEQLRFLDQYAGSEHLFTGIEAYVGNTDDDIYQDIRSYMAAVGFDMVIISQPLFRLANVTEQACKDLGVSCLYRKLFFGDRLVFDAIGSQYTPENEIARFVETIKMPNDVKKPAKTRQPQPQGISKEDFFKKYGSAPPTANISLFSGRLTKI